MIRLSISSICYLRNVFPSECFSSREYAGLKVHQIECAEKSEDGEVHIKHEDAFLLTQWLERGVFEAISKKYLKSMTFAVYTKDCNKLDVLLETYSFTFSFPEGSPAEINGRSMDRDSMKKQAVSFIRCLVEFAGTLDNLPDDKWLTIKLTYYEDITPDDYEPQYFKSAKSNILQFDKTVLRVKIGKIETPSHTLNLKFSGVDMTNDSIPVTETLSMEEVPMNNTPVKAHNTHDKENETDITISTVKQKVPKKTLSNVSMPEVENVKLSTLSIQRGQCEDACTKGMENRSTRKEDPKCPEMIDAIKDYMYYFFLTQLILDI